MSIETPSLFPCWGRHARMGHTEVIGQFFAGPGSNVTFLVPAMPADAATFRKATVARRGIAPMEGGAFFGFDELTEEQAMSALRAGQPYDHELADAVRAERRLLAQADEAVEVRDPQARLRSGFDVESEDLEDVDY